MDTSPRIDAEGPIVGSVAEIAYQRLHRQILNGSLAPSTRLNQGDLATEYGISRTSVREALHRLAAETLVEFRSHRGFFVAEPTPLDAVLHRLEVRLLLEPGIAKLAAERATAEQIVLLSSTIESEAAATSPDQAHDVSREFHMMLAEFTANEYLVRVMDSLWGVHVGRQLLKERVKMPGWISEDVSEHRAIAHAVAAGDSERASQLMSAHVARAVEHWSRRSDPPTIVASDS